MPELVRAVQKNRRRQMASFFEQKGRLQMTNVAENVEYDATTGLPAGWLSIGRDYDHDEPEQRREELAERWNEYAELMAERINEAGLAQECKFALAACNNSGLTVRAEDAQRILGLTSPDLNAARAAQVALMHVYAKSSWNQFEAAHDALTVFANVRAALDANHSMPESGPDADYPDFRIHRILPMNFDGVGDDSSLYDLNRTAASRFWLEVLEIVKDKWSFEPAVELAREHGNMLADIGIDIPASITTELLGVKHLEPETARAIQSALITIYNAERADDLWVGTMIAGLLVFIRSHPRLQDDLICDTQAYQRKNYIVAELPRS